MYDNNSNLVQGATSADTPRALFVAAGGGGDVIAASILQRIVVGTTAPPYVATYSWDRLLTDPVPGPRRPKDFPNIEQFGERNYIVSARTVMKRPAFSLLPRLGEEFSFPFFLMDPYAGALGLRRQLTELVNLLGIDIVYLVDSGGDIIARGDESPLRSPLADSLILAAADDIGADVEVLITAAGLDGELPSDYVCDAIVEAGGELHWRDITASDVDWCSQLFTWHPSEVNALLVSAAQGFEGFVEIRDSALVVHVDRRSVGVHRCPFEGVIARNLLAKSMLESRSLLEAEGALLERRDLSELEYQRKRAPLYSQRKRVDVADVDTRLESLLRYCQRRRGDIDALSLRRAAEVMELNISGLQALGSVLTVRCPTHYRPPLWMVG